VTSLLARDRGGPRIDMQILIYPITDCRFDTESYVHHGAGTNLTLDDMRYFWDHYCPDETQRVRPTASPLQEFDLSRLPPAVVITAGHDPLCSEGETYALRLERAGTPVTQIRCDGMVHGFMRRVNSFTKAREVLAELGRLVGTLTRDKFEY
jgi:acetyl esterase